MPDHLLYNRSHRNFDMRK